MEYLSQIGPIFGPVIAFLSLCLALWIAWKNFAKGKAEKLPVIEMSISESLHLSEWRHVVFTIENQLDTTLTLISVSRAWPKSLRLWRFRGHQSPPLGAPGKQIDAEISVPKKPARIGFELLFKLPETPHADSGKQVVLQLVFKDSSSGTLLSKEMRGQIPKR